MFLFTTLIKLYRRADRQICIKVCHKIWVPLKYNHFFQRKINNSYFITTAKIMKIYTCAQRKPLLSSFPFPFSVSLWECIRLFRNVYAIIMGSLSYSSYIAELFSIFYFLHASASCQINTTSMGTKWAHCLIISNVCSWRWVDISKPFTQN